MPRLTGTWTLSDGAVVPVRIGIAAADVQALRAAGRPIPQPVETTALIDTGAEITCLDPSVLARLALPFIGITPVNMPAGGGLTGGARHAGSLVVPHPSGRPRDDFRVPTVTFTEIDLGALGYEMLIGRDLLVLCVFRLDGPNRTFTLDY